jgi:branched-chain amino acid transport system ATP-binding protein
VTEAGGNGRILELNGVETYYGTIRALKGVSLEVRAGEIVTLLGANGAGKTTTLRSVMGLTPPRRGHVRFDGRDVTGELPYRMFRLGVGYVPEGRQIFPELTVAENLRLATRATAATARWPRERIFEYFPALRERWHQKGKSLSGGEQQMLAVARALAGEPELLLLDEPSQGLAPLLVRALGELLQRLRGDGLTILLVEQNVRLALAVADRVAVLSKGALVFTGALDDFNREAEDLRGRYLAP